jgi:hypothetical protein
MRIAKSSLVGSSQILALALVAALLAVSYWVLDAYSASQRDMLMVESRGMQLIQGLSRFRLERGAYPESLNQLVPAYVALLPSCPNGEAFIYRAAVRDTERHYVLTCNDVVFRQKPNRYQSNLRSWASS